MHTSNKPPKKWILKIPLGIRVFFFFLYLIILGSLSFGLLFLLYNGIINNSQLIFDVVVGVVLLVLLSGLCYMGVSVYRKINRFEKRVLLFASLFQLLILPFVLSSIDEGLGFYISLPSMVESLTLTNRLLSIVLFILLYIAVIAANSIILSLLMGSSKLENGIRKWLTGSWVGRLIREIDYYLYRDSDVLSLNFRPLIGWRKVLSPFPITLSLLSFIFLIRVALIWNHHLTYGLWDFLSYFLPVLMFFGVFVHFYSPPLSRKFKYDLILAGTTMISLNALLGYLNYLTYFFGSEFQYYFNPIVVLGSLLIVKRSESIFNRILPKEREEIMKWVKRNTLLFIPIVIFVVGDLLQLILVVYLLMRFHMVNWLFNRPILYFRSFVSDENKSNFMDIIGNVASKYGVVTGLVHTKSDSEEFRKVMRISERARLFMVPDNKWKEWVLSYMKKASAIIIDFEIETEGVTWEVEKSNEICGEEHVIILDKHFWKEEDIETEIENQKDHLESKIEQALNYR